MREKTVVKVNKANESLRLWEVIDGLDLLRNRRNTVAVNVMSQEVECGGSEQTFVWIK